MARVVTADLTKSITKGVRTELMKSFAHAPVDYTQVAMTIPSTMLTETHAWLGESHKPREWVGQRIPHDISEYSFTVENKEYEDTMVVERKAIEDEQYGQIMPRARSMGEAGRQYIDELVFTELMNGFSTACYDDSNFFAADHSEKNSGTQDNLGSDALSGAAVTTGIAEMRQFKDDQGRYLNLVPDTLIVHPDQEGTAREILLSDKDPDNANNPVNINKGRFKIIVTPYLTATYWILAKCNGPIKPAAWQDRVKIAFEDDDSKLFSDGVMQYGIRFRGKAFLTNWRLAYGSVG